MARRMLINGQRAEELRVAIIDNGKLQEYEIEVAESGLTRGNIYRGYVANVEPSLNAAFIDYGAARHGFLSINDVVEQAYHNQPNGRPRINEVLERRKPLLVQVTKDAVGTKGAQLTTNISLAGRYLVLRPYDDKSGVSRKVDDDGRAELQEKGRSLDLPEGFGYIVRTNALDQTKTALNRDATALVRLWQRILEEYGKHTKSRLLYSDQDLIVQAMRDFYDNSIAEVLIDDEDCYDKALAYVKASMPRGAGSRIARYSEPLPLFTRYNLERQIETIYKRKVPLPSGGSIVVDPTEALTAVDVNSSKSTKRGTQDETAYHTNIEAAVEVARQMRLRDIGGLTVVDFIDMRSRKNQREVEKTLKDEMKLDKARVKIGRISPNGLLEINRQRIKQAIKTRTYRSCPTCSGTGHVPSIEAVGLSLLRRIEARAATKKISGVRISLHPEVAQDVQNSRRAQIFALENEFEIFVHIISDPNTPRSEESVDWVARQRSSQSSTQEAAVGANHLANENNKIRAEERRNPPRSNESGEAADENGEEQPRRRRRRGSRGRRRGRRPSEEGMEVAEGGANVATAQNDDSEVAERVEARAPREGENGEEGEEQPPRRRRRRRRRRSRSSEDSIAASGESKAGTTQSSEDAAQSEQAPTDGQASDPTDGDRQPRQSARDGEDREGEPAERRPRRRRRRRPAASAEGTTEEAVSAASAEQVVEASPETQVRAEAKVDDEVEAEPRAQEPTSVEARAESDADPESKPAPRPRRSRARKPRPAPEETEADSASEASEAPESAATADDEAPAPKPKRTRKPRAAAKTAEPAADAAEVTEEADKPAKKPAARRAAAKKPAAKKPAAKKPAAKKAATKAPAAEADAAEAEKPAKPRRSRAKPKAPVEAAAADSGETPEADEAPAKPKRRRRAPRPRPAELHAQKVAEEGELQAPPAE